ncbi:MAG: TonB-dependent receptor [Candidatus Omnitrophica bacterium]|nr:TonB-dependent receptor [Candidatus Omnitrophota bacterium]
MVKRAYSDRELSVVYPGQILSAAQIQKDTSGDINDSLGYVSAVDLRQRGAFGTQADLTIKGSTYEQVAAVIDSINVNDPQTGHFNLDIPLTAYDIEKIQVEKQGFSSVYGAGALAGAVNFVTKKPVNNSFNTDLLFGDFNLYGQTLSISRVEGRLGARISYDHKKSSGARPDTDFDNRTGTVYLSRDLDNGLLDLLFGFQKKDFGAADFYSNLYPNEEEHTQTEFGRLGLDSQFWGCDLKNGLYLRQHQDKFILNKNNPTSVNYHTTYIYGWNSSAIVPTRAGDVSLGLDAGMDQINSTNLGKHSRLHEAGMFGITPKKINRFDSDLKFRLDHYQGWPWQESFNAGLGYELNSALRLNLSAGRAFRMPSFTELYYSDPANKGDPNLGIEKSDNLSTGAQFKSRSFDLGVDFFLRRGHDLIDWARQNNTQAWQATNLGKVDFRGIDFNLDIRPQLKAGLFSLDNVKLSYTYTDADNKSSEVQSKYALDVFKHNLNIGLDQHLCGFDLGLQFYYQQRYYANTYLFADFYLSRRFKKYGLEFEPFLKVTNFTNAKYYEVSGVLLVVGEV